MQNKFEKTMSVKSLGILGGGQLGRFFTISAQKMGYSVVVFDPDEKSPAGKIANKHICKPYDDLNALDELKSYSSAITTEFENVPAKTLQYLEKDIVVRPSSKVISIAQNRIKEKNFLKQCGIPVGAYVVIDSIESINNLDSKILIFPGILKTAQFGYDGKGQIHVNNKMELEAAFKSFNSAPCTFELKLDLDCEFSIVLARSVNGTFIVYPLIRNHHESGILDCSSIYPNSASSDLKSLAIKLAKRIANELSYVGVMAVEFFLSRDTLFVNEIAPRPHNSGHFTIDACIYNQFDQQVLTLVGEEPKKQVTKFPISLMLNILGDLWFRNKVLREPKFNMITGPGINLHLYDKEEPRIGRKMGHITIIGLANESQKDVTNKSEAIRKVLWEN